MAELADALDLGSSVYDVQVQVLSSAVEKKTPNPRVCKNTRIPGFLSMIEMPISLGPQRKALSGNRVFS